MLGSDSLHPDGGCQSDTAPPEVKQSSADLILPGGSQPRLLCAELLQPAVEMIIRWCASVVLLKKSKKQNRYHDSSVGVLASTVQRSVEVRLVAACCWLTSFVSSREDLNEFNKHK